MLLLIIGVFFLCLAIPELLRALNDIDGINSASKIHIGICLAIILVTVWAPLKNAF
jgi:hypothetical protein